MGWECFGVPDTPAIGQMKSDPASKRNTRWETSSAFRAESVGPSSWNKLIYAATFNEGRKLLEELCAACLFSARHAARCVFVNFVHRSSVTNTDCTSYHRFDYAAVVVCVVGR